MPNYGYDPARFVQKSNIDDVGEIFANYLNNIPKLIKADEKYALEKQKFAGNSSAVAQAYDDMQNAAQQIGLDPESVVPPKTGQDVDDYLSRGVAAFMTEAQSEGISLIDIRDKIGGVRGAAGQPVTQQLQGQVAQQEQLQEGVNLRSDLFGQPQPAPQEQAQDDIGQITGGQPPPSIMDSFSGGGSMGVQQQGFALTPPEQPANVLSRLQVQQPIDTTIPERRKEAMGAGISGAELDQMISDMQSGTIGIADFDNNIAKAQGALVKKKETAQKLEAIRLKEGANRLRQSQKDFVIYNKESGELSETIDYNRPDDYVVSQERRKPLASEHISRQVGGKSSKGAQSSKLLNNLIDERTKILSQMSRQQQQINLNPKLADADGINKEEAIRLYNSNKDLLRSINKQIGELQGTVETKKANQDVEISKPPKAKFTKEEYIAKLKERGVDKATIDKFLRSKGLGGLYN